MDKFPKIIKGDRIGSQGRISTGCSAVIFDDSKNKILLTKREDNDQWCLPSGRVEPGESVSEACKREIFEETGLKIEILRLVGIYSNPNQLVEYKDGNKIQLIALCFEVKIIEGELIVSDETTDFGYFTEKEIEKMDILENHTERITDAFSKNQKVFIK
jgi:ADP-ribose pyrophosphatase YjhB (NUDIX family)